ncbi:DEKNAAC101850 [Brettanomyces naardenensis]|uniref:DEKNAAC101850 n=1 Tax=Brettanomyces naardenensis TaxID=13370 RepID=A0A448YJB2_BRENA|nr:DEKNAAC101850 [Brettanomyces naardenensis]
MLANITLSAKRAAPRACTRAPLTSLRYIHMSSPAFAVKEITSATQFQNEVLKDKASFVDFYATWCGPCKAMSPFIEKFSDSYKDINFYQVDVDQFSDLSVEYGITAMPTFVLFKDGEVSLNSVGANPHAVENMLKKGSQ